MKKKTQIPHIMWRWNDEDYKNFQQFVQGQLFYKETPKQKKARLVKERKEKQRRAKKITMTIGELEDKLDEAKGFNY